jgi:two-component system CheB/CheR fusion protein
MDTSPPERAFQDSEPQEEVDVSHPVDLSEHVYDFPVVAIGASAGGLHAFEEFFTHTPPDTGMAFVLVQHLAPDHESMLVDLIQRYTQIRVEQVKEGMRLEPNHIYVIPPGWVMTLSQGQLHLYERERERLLNPLPIDLFFRSLAQEQRERAIGVILSGTGTDGTAGLQEIKAEGGMVMVQKPESAQYGGMPRSAIQTGLVDYVLPPAQMPQELITYVENAMVVPDKRGKRQLFEGSEEIHERLFNLLRAQTGHDFSLYKPTTINRRVRRRMVVNRMNSLKEYVRYLEEHPEETETLFRELLIGVTHFFRDAEAFRALEQKGMPLLFNGRQTGEEIRVWVCGCSTGEEAYSIAILMIEQMERLDKHYDVQVFATDIDAHAIATARLGYYPANIVADVSSERLKRFFREEDNGYRVKKHIRDMVVFAEQDLIRDPPFSRLDLISCRNVLIYMGRELQRRVLPLFHYALREDGLLFLGTSESVRRHENLFKGLDRSAGLYRRKNLDPTTEARDLVLSSILSPSPNSGTEERKSMELEDLAQQALLHSYAPPSVIVNEEGEVRYFHGRTVRYLELPQGRASLNVLDMAREGLRLPLTAALRQARDREETIFYERLRIESDGKQLPITLRVTPLRNPAALQGLLLVSFEPLEEKPNLETPEESKDSSQQVQALRHKLHTTREYLQTVIEELETSNEELQSTNEELQSTNEELQTTNEELETSKEELQSVNEELSTINAELESKIEALTEANNDLKNMITSTDVGTLFLDLNLNIRRFTPAATEFIHLIESDVGRPLHHLTSKLQYPHLIRDVEQVLDDLQIIEREVQTEDGQWYWMKVMPYRTTEGRVDGVVVTFTEITEKKEVQRELHMLRRAVEEAPAMIAVTDEEGGIEYANPRFIEALGYEVKEALQGETLRIFLKNDSDEEYSRMWDCIRERGGWRGNFHHLGAVLIQGATTTLKRAGREDRGMVVVVVRDVEDEEPAQK